MKDETVTVTITIPKDDADFIASKDFEFMYLDRRDICLNIGDQIRAVILTSRV